MNSYRDDIQETAVAADTTWLKVLAITAESAKAAGAALFGLLVLHAETAVAADEAWDSVRYAIEDQARAADTVHDQLEASVLLEQTPVLGESLWERLTVVHVDSVPVADEVVERFGAVVDESARCGDLVLGQRRVSVELTELAWAGDQAFSYVVGLALDELTASDGAADKLHAAVALMEGATLNDLVLHERQSRALVAEEPAAIHAEILDHLHATERIGEIAIVEDWMPPDSGVQQAWTANSDTWAMSRYSPFSCIGLAVIDGALHLIAEDGIYRADTEPTETIDGRIRTGKVDLGQGGLVHPQAVYLEYALVDGTAHLDVLTTQTGTAQTYRYALPEEPASELTNGRFTLGRGLRGRHFGFELHLTGKLGQVNDMRVESAPTKRRV